jgi:peroxiredoxin
MRLIQKKWWIPAGVAVVGFALTVGFFVRQSLPGRPPQAEQGFAMPTPENIYEAEFDDEDGRTVQLARWKGKLVVLNFWATWCAPCVKEMPELQRVQDQIGPAALTILGIGAEPPAAVRDFRKANGLRFALLAGSFEAINAARALGDRQGVLPYTALLSPEGRVLHTHVGELPPGLILEWVEEFRKGSTPRS